MCLIVYLQTEIPLYIIAVTEQHLIIIHHFIYIFNYNLCVCEQNDTFLLKSSLIM